MKFTHLPDSFWTNVIVTGSINSHRPELGKCWLWTGGRTSQGYGTFRVDGNLKYAHRLSYEDQIGPIAFKLQIDHLCRVTSCVNPSHLNPVTARENSLAPGSRVRFQRRTLERENPLSQRPSILRNKLDAEQARISKMPGV